jgi:PD-(D/E)XK nuclease superfamily
MDEERDPLTEAVIGAAIEVHRIMGPGLLESVYQRCLNREMQLRGMSFVPLASLPVSYKGENLGDELVPIHDAQLLTYLRLSKIHVGLLINFNVRLLKDGIKRLVL